MATSMPESSRPSQAASSRGARSQDPTPAPTPTKRRGPWRRRPVPRSVPTVTKRLSTLEPPATATRRQAVNLDTGVATPSTDHVDLGSSSDMGDRTSQRAPLVHTAGRTHLASESPENVGPHPSLTVGFTPGPPPERRWSTSQVETRHRWWQSPAFKASAVGLVVVVGVTTIVLGVTTYIVWTSESRRMSGKEELTPMESEDRGLGCREPSPLNPCETSDWDRKSRGPGTVINVTCSTLTPPIWLLRTVTCIKGSWQVQVVHDEPCPCDKIGRTSRNLTTPATSSDKDVTHPGRRKRGIG